MKITYEIDTKDPDQAVERRQLEKAADMANVLFQMSLHVKKAVREKVDSYIEQGRRVSSHDVLEMVYQEYNELIELHGINVEELNNQ